MKKRINIMHLITNPTIGGLETVVFNLLQHLNREKYNVYLGYLDNKTPQLHKFQKAGIKTYCLYRKIKRIDYHLPFRLGRILKNKKIQLLHSHNASCFFFGTIASNLARIKANVFTEHGRMLPDRRLIKITNRFLSHFNDRTVTVSQDMKKKLLYYEKFNPQKVSIILNGVDLQKNDNETFSNTEFMHLKDDYFLIGIIARLVPVKNHMCLFRALERIIRKYLNIRLLIIGDGPLKTKLIKKAFKMGIESYISFLGERNDVTKILNILDLFVLPSVNEGLSMTLLEAMASGVPVIASDVGGNPEIIKHCINGYLFPTDDDKKLSNIIISLIQKPGELERIGKIGKQTIVQRFTLNRMAREYEQLYQHLLFT